MNLKKNNVFYLDQMQPNLSHFNSKFNLSNSNFLSSQNTANVKGKLLAL